MSGTRRGRGRGKGAQVWRPKPLTGIGALARARRARSGGLGGWQWAVSGQCWRFGAVRGLGVGVQPGAQAGDWGGGAEGEVWVLAGGRGGTDRKGTGGSGGSGSGSSSRKGEDDVPPGGED